MYVANPFRHSAMKRPRGSIRTRIKLDVKAFLFRLTDTESLGLVPVRIWLDREILYVPF